MGFWDSDKGKDRPPDPYGPAKRDRTSREIQEAEMNLRMLLDVAAAWAQCRLRHKIDFTTESWEGENGLVLQHQSKGWVLIDSSGKTTRVQGNTFHFLVGLAQALAKAVGKECRPFPTDRFGADDESFLAGFAYYFKGKNEISSDLLANKNPQ